MFHIGGKDHLIAKDPDLKDNEIRYIGANKDLYDILRQSHESTGHPEPINKTNF